MGCHQRSGLSRCQPVKTPDAIPGEVRGVLIGLGLFQVGLACAVIAICLTVPGARRQR